MLLRGCPVICRSSELWENFPPNAVFHCLLVYICRMNVYLFFLAAAWYDLVACVLLLLKKLYICHPPPPFCMAFSHNSFSRLTAFCLRVKSSTARFLLHRKFVSLWMRSGSWFTWAPTDAEMDERQRVSTNETCSERSVILTDLPTLSLLWIIDCAATWSSSGSRRVFKLVTPGCFLCGSPFRKSTCGCGCVAALIAWNNRFKWCCFTDLWIKLKYDYMRKIKNRKSNYSQILEKNKQTKKPNKICVSFFSKDPVATTLGTCTVWVLVNVGISSANHIAAT